MLEYKEGKLYLHSHMVTSDVLCPQLERIIEDSDNPTVVIPMVPVVGSLVIGLLYVAGISARDQGKELSVICNDRVYRVLKSACCDNYPIKVLCKGEESV